MTQYNPWEFFIGEIPTGKVQVWVDGKTKEHAQSQEPNLASNFYWDNIIAFRSVKSPVRSEVVVNGRIRENGPVFGNQLWDDTHRLILPTDDGNLICGEYLKYDGTIVKIEVR